MRLKVLKIFNGNDSFPFFLSLEQKKLSLIIRKQCVEKNRISRLTDNLIRGEN